jgi:FtsX-like permease family
MAVVWVLAWARLRGRWRTLLGLTVLLGVASGAVMVAAIGVRRTQTAYPRLLEATRYADAQFLFEGLSEEDPRLIDGLRRLPQVADLGLQSVALVAPDMPGEPSEFPPFTRLATRFVGLMSVDGRAGWTVNRPLILAGRRPDPGRSEEVGLSESLARRWRVRPGDTIRLRALAPDQLRRALTGKRVIPAGPALTLTVVAIQRLPDDLLTDPQIEGFVSLTPAFYRTYRDRIAHFPAEPQIRLKRGHADVWAFWEAAGPLSYKLANNPGQVSGTGVAFGVADDIEQGIRAEAVALTLFAALAALAALVVIGQTLTRELSLAMTGHETLRALGMSRAQLFTATMLPVGLVGALGGLVGAGLAVMASPLTPIGLARQAEPARGLSVHLAGIGIGIVATLGLILAWTAVPAWRLARVRPEEQAVGRAGASSTLANAAARAGLPPSAVAGLRLVLEQGRGPTAVPVRTTLVGVTAGIVALAAALTFTASLDRLLDTPRLYGWNFDAIAFDWTLDEPSSRRPPQLASNPHVGSFSAVYVYAVMIDGWSVTAAAIDTADGQVFPTIVEGHEPRGPDEVVIGTYTLRQLGRRLGQTVQVRDARPTNMRIVGRTALLPGMDIAAAGAILTLEGLQRLEPNPKNGDGVFYIRYAPDADPAAALRSLQRPSSDVQQDVQLPRPPIDVENLGRVGNLPPILAGLLALLAAAALTHLLVTSIRRRRRDLAILKTLGFVRGQVSATVAWQATTVAVVALLVGVPLGVALGRWSWTLLMDRIGLGAEPVIPHLALLAGALATVLVANLLAAWPGWVAARTRPAVTLRAE